MGDTAARRSDPSYTAPRREHNAIVAAHQVKYNFFMRGFSPPYAKEEVVYVTFLRDPVQR